MNVTGEGFAKAESSGSAEAYALATAKAIALGVTEAANLQQRSYSRVIKTTHEAPKHIKPITQNNEV